MMPWSKEFHSQFATIVPGEEDQNRPTHGSKVLVKGHADVCMELGKGASYVAQLKQKLVAKSTNKTEIIGVSDGLSEVIWARNFILAQGIDVGPATVFRSTSSRTRHIHIL